MTKYGPSRFAVALHRADSRPILFHSLLPFILIHCHLSPRTGDGIQELQSFLSTPDFVDAIINRIKNMRLSLASDWEKGI